MKLLLLLPLCGSLILVSCESMNAPLSSSSFDPLTPPGSGRSVASLDSAASFKPGQYVHASMDSTAFFSRRPKGDADADKLLKRNTQMRVVSTDASYAKVELDSGEVGFVPTVMLEAPGASEPAVETVNPSEFQVYPPVPGSGAADSLPVFDPTGLPPEGTIPTVIEPDGPMPEAPPVTDGFPAVPAGETVPLPPNSEELEAAAAEPKAEKEEDEEN